MHVRAILGLPIPTIKQLGPSASSVILVTGEGSEIRFSGLAEALATEGTDLRLFGKPEVSGRRRMGVGLARAQSIDDALALAKSVSGLVSTTVE